MKTKDFYIAGFKDDPKLKCKLIVIKNFFENINICSYG